MPDERHATVLIVDHDPEPSREILSYLNDRGYQVEWVGDAEKAFNRLDARFFDVLVTELTIHRVDGMRLMAVARERNPDICVVFIAAPPDTERATEALREGAYDFQTKPVNLGKLEAVIRRGLAHQRLVMERHELQRRLDEHYGLGSLVGNSRPMLLVYNAVRKAAPTDAPVLLQGEPGTGKDLIALSLHNNSARRDEAFVAVNCGGLPERQMDAELFGHGGGAASARPGRVELADHGTLYLDEVGDLTPAQQERVFHVIDGKGVRREGDARRVSVQVRVLASTSRPLTPPAFREDLLERLRGVFIEAPALRDRREDIPLLAQHFLREASRVRGIPNAVIAPKALDLLMRYDWPGNVRELRNTLEGMAIGARGGRPLDVGDVPPHIRRGVAPQGNEIRIPVGTPMDAIERMAIEETLRACGYNKEACARTLGIGLRTLYRKLKQYQGED
ncbi:MAG: sigma-54 dependent transcriptional regulator [Candidatus Hydrogenedentes bacterium]|nr:sigma-54 dependent transcriptional regulator [Candidatus Hydrogenedentota bacterium]